MINRGSAFIFQISFPIQIYQTPKEYGIPFQVILIFLPLRLPVNSEIKWVPMILEAGGV